MPRTTDDLFNDEHFESVEDLEDKIPDASPELVRKLEDWLGQREEEETPTPTPKPRPKTHHRPRSVIISTNKRGVTQVRNAKTGRFVSSPKVPRTRGRTHRIRKSKKRFEEE